MRSVAIYALVGDDGAARYVGSSTHPQRRFCQHRGAHEKTNEAKRRWLRSQANPRLIVLDRVSAEERVRTERRWVRRIGDRFQLLNRNKPGAISRGRIDLLAEPTAAEKEAIERIRLGRPLSRANVGALIARALRTALVDCDLTVVEAAQEMRVDQSSVRRFLAGKAVLPVLRSARVGPGFVTHLLAELEADCSGFGEELR